MKKKVDYCSNISPRTFPRGLDVEVFSQKALEFSLKKARTRDAFEHVTTIMRKSKKIKKQIYSVKKNCQIYVLR